MSYEKLIVISPRGQLVLPKKVREILNLDKKPHLKITVDEERKSVTLRPVKSFSDQLEGSAKGLLKKGEDALSYTAALREEN